MKKNSKTPLALAMGASLLPAMAAQVAYAEVNPFALSELQAGYMQTAEANADKDGAAKMKDGACGEGKCGAAMMKPSTDKKALEGKCAGNKPAPAPPANDDKKAESQSGASMNNMK